MKVAAALHAVAVELDAAQLRFEPFASTHEGYAVLLEELDELWAEVKDDKRRDDLRKAALRNEATQLAAMALRFMVDLT